MSTPNVNKGSVARGTELRYDTLLVGLATLSPTTQLTIENVGYTPGTLAAAITTQNAVNKTIRQLRLQLTQALTTRKGQKTRDRQFIAAIRASIVGLVGDESSDLVKFGFNPRKTHSATVEEKTLAVARGKDTREKRGTLGPRAKAAIQGDKPQQVTVTAAGGMVVPPPPPPPTPPTKV
jgi:hypothetical protein